MALRDERCQACTAATPRLTADELAAVRSELHPAWEVVRDGTTLRRSLRFPDFAAAFALATRIALVAQEHGHHPDLSVGWGRLDVDITTHAVNGLTRNDGVLAANVDAVAGG